MLSALLHRIARRPQTLMAAGRVAVCPPLFMDTEPAWKYGMSRWLRGPQRHDTERFGRLAQVKEEFFDAAIGLCGEQVSMLLDRIDRARSLLELWHLRTELYHLVALQHSQNEAERRLALLNRHYPARSPRSGFVPLAA